MQHLAALHVGDLEAEEIVLVRINQRRVVVRTKTRMLSLNGIVLTVWCVLVSAIDITLPLGDMKANLPSGSDSGCGHWG